MSKKSIFASWNDKTVDGATTQAAYPQPELFSRRVSKGGPFIISQSDNPYEKRHLGNDYQGQRQEAFSKSKHNRVTSLSALGINTRLTNRSSKRSRRAIAVGLLVAVIILLNYFKAVPKYLPSPPAGLAVPSLKAALWSKRQSAHAIVQSAGMQSSSHTFHPNGLLLVNPHGRHPIDVLIEGAEKKWKTLLEKQSTSLEDAATEYKMRYKRNPPRGFDKWWSFAQQNKVILVDEHDQIARDFEPFFALEPHDLRHRNKVMQDREHTFTLSFTDGYVSRHGPHADNKRAKDMAQLMNKFAKFVPGQVNLTFVIDDNPAVMMGWNQKERMLELASQGEYWGPSEFVDPEDPDISNFAKACPPSSLLRRAEEGSSINTESKDYERSFIHNHAKAVDICSHPEFHKLHGSTTQGGMPLTPLVPLFSWAKTNVHNDLLVTPLEQYDDDYLVYDPPFEYKMKDKLLWRGSTTGSEFRVGYNWERSQRARLHFMAAERDGKKEIMWSDDGSLKMQNITTKMANGAYMDVKFSGQPAQCDPETCKKMEEVIDFAPTMGLEDQSQYRYHMDVDGNGWSGRFHRLLSSNSVVLKSTIFPEWYQDRIVPWVHYVPVKVDYSDLYDIMAFFVGNGDGKGAHEKQARRIGEQGKEFAAQHWRRADMASYMFRMVLEYARLLQQEDGEEVDFFI